MAFVMAFRFPTPLATAPRPPTFLSNSPCTRPSLLNPLSVPLISVCLSTSQDEFRLTNNSLFIFPGWLCHFKGLFSYLFGAKFTGRNFYRWHHDNWPIGQWVIFHAAPVAAYVNHFFFPLGFLIWFNTSRPWDFVTLLEWQCFKLALPPFKNLWEVDL